jgi:Ca2+:H+ antiporter
MEQLRQTQFRANRIWSPRLLARAWWVLLALGPIGLLGDHLGWPASTVFILAGLGTVPAAALLGRATEEVALGVAAWDVRRRGLAVQPADSATLGAKIGGLLNATFGNIPELIIGILALHQGYITLTKATIIGSVIGNIALVVGLALFLGGVRNGTQRFDAAEAGHHAVLLVLTVASLALPSLFLASTGSHYIMEISVVAAALLLGIYLAYLLYSIFQFHGGSPGSQRDTADRTFIEEEAEIVQMLRNETKRWPIQRSVAVLALATLLVFGASEALIDTVAPFTASLGWSPFFIGIVVVPILANVAEHMSAVQLAFRNKMDAALGVASGSAIQVAVFVAPLLVLISQFEHRLDLVFNAIEVAVLALVVTIFFFVSRDGESNWLEGLQLIVLYVLAAAVFFYMPGQLR